MSIRIGLDIGIASVGWAVVTDDYSILEAGSNLFESAEAGNNIERRENRQRRRLIRRQKTRINDFNKLWMQYSGVIPAIKDNDVLFLRVKGISESLDESEIYRVLLNMLKHRGISYLEDFLDEDTGGRSDYERGIKRNALSLEDKFPCEIQLERLKSNGKYRGNTTIIENGEKITLSNVFTVTAYRKELEKFFDVQRKYHDFISKGFTDRYFDIFNRKRKYYDGPGNELSRTDYGKYTTKINPDTGEYITEKNIFDKLVGKCSVYPEEQRGAGASYTAQEFNALNDLNNLTVNGRKLSKEEKEYIINAYKTEKTMGAGKVRKIISKAMGEEIESFSGARIDKSEKEIFHSFDTYRKLKNAMEKEGLSIDRFNVDELDEIGRILTLNTDRESIEEAFSDSATVFKKEEKDCLIEFRKKNSQLFSKWQSFSIKIMRELIPEMYEQPKEQMTLLTEMGVFKPDTERYKEYSKIPADEVLEEIYNPVVKRSVRIAVDIVNALKKKYGNPEEIVIEMPRDRNSDEEKKRINDFQRNQEKELKEITDKLKNEYGITIYPEDYHRHQQLNLKLKLWNEQEGRCPYSGRMIEITDLLNRPELFEVDHIIPRSISFDDSRANKVLVYATENQKKGNMTPYFYLRSVDREWGYDEYKELIRSLSAKKKIRKKKASNFLFTDDITKIDVLKGFISRNLNDTRYASRVVLNIMQNYFRAKECDTKVKVIRGSFTGQMRKNLKLEKNREESYSHHAVDAMLICYSQMGYDAYRKLQDNVIDWETGEIIDEANFEKVFSDNFYEEEMYNKKWWDLGETIKEAEKHVKYWHKADRKYNRTLCNQTIRGTREIDGKLYKINKADIRTEAGYKLFKKKVETGKKDDFLMALHDPKTFDSLVKIMTDYKDAKNPFTAYEEETGDVIRRYSKKGNGPKIGLLRYKDGEVGSCIDISDKYGHRFGSRKVILESLNPYRMDVYYSREKEQYYLIGIKYSDCRYKDGVYVIDEDAYCDVLRAEKLIGKDEGIKALADKGIEFRLSFYKNEIINYEKNGEYFTERFLSRTMPKQRNYIETKPVNRAKFDKQNLVGLSKTKKIRKIRTDILGNTYACEHENFTLIIDKDN